MSAEILDDVTILAMRICATRHDAMVSGEAFITLLRQLLRTAVDEAVAAVVKPPLPTWDAVLYDGGATQLRPLAEPAADKPAAPDRSVAAPAVGTAPAPLSGVPAPSQPAPNRRTKVSDADREQLRRDYLEATANGAALPPKWAQNQADRLGVTDAAIYYILKPVRLVSPQADVATLPSERAAPRAKPHQPSASEPREPASAPPDEEPAPAPKRKPPLKHRELTAPELAELVRRCDIVTNDRKLSIPYDWARQRGEELGVPATTIFQALTKSTSPRKERDPVKALQPPQPRVRHMYGKYYGGASE